LTNEKAPIAGGKNPEAMSVIRVIGDSFVCKARKLSLEGAMTELDLCVFKKEIPDASLPQAIAGSSFTVNSNIQRYCADLVYKELLQMKTSNKKYWPKYLENFSFPTMSRLDSKERQSMWIGVFTDFARTQVTLPDSYTWLNIKMEDAQDALKKAFQNYNGSGAPLTYDVIWDGQPKNLESLSPSVLATGALPTTVTPSYGSIPVLHDAYKTTMSWQLQVTKYDADENDVGWPMMVEDIRRSLIVGQRQWRIQLQQDCGTRLQFHRGTWMELVNFLWKPHPSSEDDCGVSVVDASVAPSKYVKIQLVNFKIANADQIDWD
jgi:hypothetical protein